MKAIVANHTEWSSSQVHRHNSWGEKGIVSLQTVRYKVPLQTVGY